MALRHLTAGGSLSGPRRRSRRASGLTLIEVLVAALLLLVIALGVLPMFVSAMTSNVSGEKYTEMANYARARAEEFMQLPFSLMDPGNPGALDPNYPLNVVAGTEHVTNEYYSLADEIWKPGAPTAGDPAKWLRTTTVRQYNVLEYLVAIKNGDTPTPLDATATPGSIHLKEVTVTVASPVTSGWARLGAARQFSVAMMKAK